jgi:hypothetical protein
MLRNNVCSISVACTSITIYEKPVDYLCFFADDSSVWRSSGVS